MHELSLCQSIYAIADRAREARPVATVHLRIGELRQVVPDTLVYCWDLLTEETDLAGARLEIERVPVEVECLVCGAATRVGPVLDLTCSSCGSRRVSVLSGEEFFLASLELHDSELHDSEQQDGEQRATAGQGHG